MIKKLKTSIYRLVRTLRGDIPHCTAIVPAAGTSSRFSGGDKLWAPLPGGMPVLARTLRALEDTPEIAEIIVATREEQIERVVELARRYDVKKLSRVVHGGETRTASVQAALLAVSDRTAFVAVHDGARPLALPEMIGEVIRCACRTNAAIAAVPVKDTIKIAQKRQILSTPDRSTMYAAQTPQVFERYLLEAALIRAGDTVYTDDAAAVEAFGVCVHIVQGDYENIKITTEEDLVFCREIVKRRACASDTATTSTA